jgi:hypothetical protein
MVKVVNIKREQEKAIIVAFADSKSDVTSGMEVIGLPEGTEIAWGSSILTADGDVGLLDSEGTWHWVGEEE